MSVEVVTVPPCAINPRKWVNRSWFMRDVETAKIMAETGRSLAYIAGALGKSQDEVQQCLRRNFSIEVTP